MLGIKKSFILDYYCTKEKKEKTFIWYLSKADFVEAESFLFKPHFLTLNLLSMCARWELLKFMFQKDKKKIFDK